MRPYAYKRVNSGMTLIEVLMVLAAVFILVAMYLSSLPKQHIRTPNIQCINNLKQVGLATRVWEGDHNDRYPTAESVTNGGAMEFTTGPSAFRIYQVMSNELSTPKVVFCPMETDPNRFTATNFTDFNNSNISFFVGVDANEALPQSLLYGDHNLTNGMPLNKAILEVTTNQPAGWTSEIHRWFGNLCLADGSVLRASNVDLRMMVGKTGVGTNRLQMPVLGP